MGGTHLEALGEVATWTGSGIREAALAARAAPLPAGAPGPVDVLLDAMPLRLADGYPAAAAGLARSLELFRTLDVASDEACRWLWLTGPQNGSMLAIELWDFDSWQAAATCQLQVARDNGALLQVRFAILFTVLLYILRGELAEAARLSARRPADNLTCIRKPRSTADLRTASLVAYPGVRACALWGWSGVARLPRAAARVCQRPWLRRTGAAARARTA